MFTSTVLFTFTFGLIWGSFLNVCIYRIPRGIFWGSSRSFCPHCKKEIPFYFNIPLLSYIFLLGKSACCKKKISPEYPLVEILTAVLLVLLIFRLRLQGVSIFQLHYISSKEWFRLLHGFLFISIMVVTSVIDFHFMIIPDKISIPGIFATPLVIMLHPELSWKSGLLGVLLGGGFIFALAWFYHFLRKKEGIGMGDAKLLALMGGWLGYEALFPILFYSSLSGSLIGIILLSAQKKLSMKAAIPFGPFLALGALIQLLSPVSFWSFFL